MALDAWQRFRERIVSGDRRAVYLAYWTMLRELSELAPAVALPKLRELVSVERMDEPAFQRFREAILLADGAYSERAGLHDPIDSAEWRRRFEAFVGGDDPDAARYYNLLTLRFELDAIRKPQDEQPPYSPEELQLSQAVSALWSRLAVAAKKSAPGFCSPDVIDELLALISEYCALLDRAERNNRARREVHEALATATDFIAGASVSLGRLEAAKEWFTQALAAYRVLGDQKGVQRCRRQLDGIDDLATGDVDESLRPALAALVAADDRPRTIDRANATVKLLTQSVRVGDLFEARRLIGEATTAMEEQLYPDPGAVAGDLGRILVRWIDAVPAELHGMAFMAELIRVVTLYADIAGARATVAGNSDPSAAARAREQMGALLVLPKRMRDESTAADLELERRFAHVRARPLGAIVADATVMDWVSGRSDSLGALDEQADAAQDAIIDIASRLPALQDEKVRRVDHGEALDDLLDEAERLQSLAGEANQPTYAALAAIQRADILLVTERAHEALVVLNDARAAFERAYGSVSDANYGAQQRVVGVKLLWSIAETYIALQDIDALSKTCGVAIAQIERDRYKVSSAYQQSAFLSTRAMFYTVGVGAALMTKDYDAMLERAELSKARAAALVRFHADDAPQPQSPDHTDLELQFRGVTEEIRARRERSDVTAIPELVTRRRRIWDLLAIGRARSRAGAAADGPRFSLGAVQSALAPDEAALYYYWLSPGVLLVVALGREEFSAERVVLSDAERASLDEVISAVDGLNAALVDFEPAVQSFSTQLLPEKAAALIGRKRRIIVSPHRGLHLFPFHALKWDDGLFVERFAVSYAPNLTILLAPPRAPRERSALIMSVRDFSVPGETLRSLPGTAAETDAVSESYRLAGVAVETLTNERLTKRELQRRSDAGTLESATVVHLATHGTSVLADDTRDEPMESHVYLYDAPLDGLEIAHLRLDADVVVLSACDSGQRATGGRGMPDMPGDDLFGLQSAFALAGARSVLGCLWRADDTAATKIVGAFHRHLSTGLPPDVALQYAVRECLREGHREIFYWGPFFISNLGLRTQARSEEQQWPT